MTPPLVALLNLPPKASRHAVRLASNIILGLELDRLKQIHGYCGSGRPQIHRTGPGSGERLSWEEFCQAQAGVTDDTARAFVQCSVALKQRLHWDKTIRDRKRLLKQLEMTPSEIPEPERMQLIERVSQLVNGWTQDKMCKEEFRALKLTPEDMAKRPGESDEATAARVERTKKTRVYLAVTSQSERQQHARKLAAVMMILAERQRNPRL